MNTLPNLSFNMLQLSILLLWQPFLIFIWSKRRAARALQPASITHSWHNVGICAGKKGFLLYAFSKDLLSSLSNLVSLTPSVRVWTFLMDTNNDSSYTAWSLTELIYCWEIDRGREISLHLWLSGWCISALLTPVVMHALFTCVCLTDGLMLFSTRLYPLWNTFIHLCMWPTHIDSSTHLYTEKLCSAESIFQLNHYQVDNRLQKLGSQNEGNPLYIPPPSFSTSSWSYPG